MTSTTSEYWIERLDRDSGSWSEVTVAHHIAGRRGVRRGRDYVPDEEVLFTPRATLMSGGSITLASSTGEESTLDGQVATGRFMPGGGNTR